MNKKTTLITTLLIITLSLTAITTAGASTPGTVAVWHFDEGTGSTATDATGNGNDGTLSGGRFGNALYFDGTDDYVTIPDSPSLDAIEDLTVELWVKPSVDYTAGPVFYVFASKYTPSTSFQFCYHKAGYLYLYVSNGIAVESTPLTLTADNWYHLAATFDSGAANGQIFVNGVDVTSSTSVRTMTQNDQPLCIGVRADNLDHEVKGILDEVRVSDTIRYSTGFTVQIGPFSDDSDTVGLWHFDESTGATAYDSSSNGNDGTIIGATWAGPTWTNGYFGKALNFDGVDDYVEVHDNADLDITGDITLEVWAYPRVIDTYKSIIVKGDATTDFKITYGLQIQGEGTDGIIRYFQYGSGYHWIDSTVPVTQNAWNYIAVTRDASNNAKIYLNGVLVGSGTLLSGPVNDFPLDIGMHDHVSLGAGQYFDGKLDEIRIWDEVLSLETIKQHQCLVGEWDFDENTGTTAHDTSGFENHGTLNGASWTTGKYGSALSLDGNDWVTVPDAYSLDLDQFTLEAWVKIDSHSQYDCILAKGWNNGQNYGLFVTPSGTIRLQFQDSGAYTQYETYIDSTGTILDGEWHYIVGTFDGANLRLYIDGTLEAEGSGTTKTPDHSIYDLTFGARYDGSGTLGHYTQGAVDEVKIWSCAKIMPEVDADGDYTVDEGSPISLDGSGSSDDGTIVSYEWDLDEDGEYDDASGVSPSYSWEDNGFYTIGLKVTDDEGYWSVDDATVTVNNVAPTISSVSGDTISENGDATVSGSFTDPGTLDTFTVTIDWGEGSPEIFPYPAGSTGFSETHQYLDDDPTGTPSDDYTIGVTVTDDDTGSDTDSTTVTVNNVAPTVDAGEDLTTQINLPTSFSGSFTDPGTLDTHTYKWTWGDGSLDTTGTLTPTHTYATAGVYTVTLEVTDDDTGVGSDTLRVVVLPYSDITDSGLCPDFDKDEADGDQFRIIYTPDVSNDPSTYKLTATNPGQFYYNVFHVGDIVEDEPFWLSIPYPFETQGANPIHVYDDVDIAESGCYIPGTDITSQFNIKEWSYALYFDEGHDYIDFGDVFAFGSGEEFTAECWISTTQTPLKQVEILGTYGNEETIHPDPDQFWGIFMIPTGEARFYLRTNDGQTTEITGTSTVNDGEWHHIAVVKDTTSGTGRLYVDGVLEGELSFNDGPTENEYPFRIGDGHWNRWYNGYVDEVRISDNVHYDSDFDTPGPFDSDSNTLALWHFDEGTGQIVGDETANYDGYLGSSTDPDDNDPEWTPNCMYEIVPTTSGTGVYYINIHLDYGLKKTTGYEPQPYDENDLQKAHAISDDVVIPDLETYEFSVSGPVSDSQTVQSRNVFKKIRGIIGYIAGASEGDEVEITGPGWDVIVYVDEDGFYGHSFHHKGKEFYYTINPEGYPHVEVPLKAGKLAEVNFPYV